LQECFAAQRTQDEAHFHLFRYKNQQNFTDPQRRHLNGTSALLPPTEVEADVIADQSVPEPRPATRIMAVCDEVLAWQSKANVRYLPSQHSDNVAQARLGSKLV
jgi:hypothetical protein